MGYFCHKCAKELTLGTNAFVARGDECPACKADLHVCLNCLQYDKNAYNQCRDPQAERVLDKDRSNFCDYFKFRSADSAGAAKQDDKKSQLKKLDDLFK